MKRLTAITKLPTLVFAGLTILLPNRLAMAQVSAYKRSDLTNSVVFRGNADHHIWELSLTPGSGWQRNDLFQGWFCNWCRGAVTADSNPMGYVRNDNINAVVYAGTDHNIYELSRQSGKWYPGNLSTNRSPVAPPAAPSASPWGYVKYEKISAVVYRGSDYKIYELSLANDGWHWQNLFYWTPNPVPPATDPVAYVTGYYKNAVVYVGVDQHVHQLEWSGNDEDGWQQRDLTQSAGAPLASLSTRPTTFVSSQGTTVAYTGKDGHICLLYFADGQLNWFYKDPNPNPTTASLALTSPVAYKRYDNYYSIVYGGNNNDLYELASLDAYNWWPYDLSTTAGGTGWIGPGDPAAYVRSDNCNSVMFTQAFSYYIEELTLCPGGSWQSWSLGSH
jgi:hypothetical protein